VQDPTESAVIVACPPVEPVVGPHRERLDWSAARGVPAHVTVLYPFVPPSDIDAGLIDKLSAAIVAVPRFEATFETTGWFGTDVLWLDPQPDERFRTLTTAVVEAFPDYPPYGGAFEDVVPHLTVGDNAEPPELRAVEERVRPQLPINLAVTAAALWVGRNAAASWHQVTSLPLG
jgi:2'-5' RNA ligase